MTGTLPSLDAHAHLAPKLSTADLAGTGSVCAMTLGLVEAAGVADRREQAVVWGPGCHPRRLKEQQYFDPGLFRKLAERSAVIGEIGLDGGWARVYGVAPLSLQLANFRAELTALRDLPRFVSIHSFRATRAVLDELRRQPIRVPVLHWWTGSAAETSEAVELGCYFSVHSAVARQSKWRTRVPLERILVESDHGYADPPAAIPCRIEWVEHLVGQQYGIPAHAVREAVWRNFGAIVRETATAALLPEGMREGRDRDGLPA